MNDLRVQVSQNWLILYAFCLFGGLLVPQLEIAVMVFFSLRALKGPKETMEAAFICCFFLLANPVVVEGATRSYLRYVFLVCGLFSLLSAKSNGKVPVTKFLWLFLVSFCSISLLNSSLPVISILKVISFFMGAYIMVEGFSLVAYEEKYWFKLINTFFVFLTLGSLVFLVLGYGYETNGRGFQGVLSHPQNFGPVMGVIAAWYTGMTLSARRTSQITLVLLVLSLIFVLLSLARTGMVAFILGGGVAYFVGLGQTQNQRYRAKGLQLGAIAVGLLLVAALANPSFFNETLVSFVQKREGGTTDTGLNDLFNQSRGGLTLSSLDNFQNNPILGIGFGVPSNLETLEDLQNIKYVYGIPVSASVEKGFLPTAILEELGIVGAIATVVLVVLLIKKIRRRATFPLLWIAFTALFINIGEAIFYSVGGTGFFMWLIVGLCYSFRFFSVAPNRLINPSQKSLRSRNLPGKFHAEISQLP